MDIITQSGHLLNRNARYPLDIRAAQTDSSWRSRQRCRSGSLPAMRLTSLVCLASLGWLADVHSASASIAAKLDDPYTNESETQTFTVNADGSFSKLDSMTLHVNNEAGVARVAQQYVWFNRNMADVQIIEAYTTTADGVLHDLPPEQIRSVQEARAFDAPMFLDIQDK